MKAKELRDLTVEELLEKERQFLEEQYNLRFQDVTGQLENSGRIREVRRTLARIKTILGEKAKVQ
ncbi:50S ribosomal protein L29 [bacterium]|jgi:large subunit ribosomal protein L29|nr:50S ribosomal protein L29 [bacterium]